MQVAVALGVLVDLDDVCVPVVGRHVAGLVEGRHLLDHRLIGRRQVPVRVVVLVAVVGPQRLLVRQLVGEPLVVEVGVGALAVCHAESPYGVLGLPLAGDLACDVLYVVVAEDASQQHDAHPLVVVGEEEPHAEAALDSLDDLRYVDGGEAVAGGVCQVQVAVVLLVPLPVLLAPLGDGRHKYLQLQEAFDVAYVAFDGEVRHLEARVLHADVLLPIVGVPRAAAVFLLLLGAEVLGHQAPDMPPLLGEAELAVARVCGHGPELVGHAVGAVGVDEEQAPEVLHLHHLVLLDVDAQVLHQRPDPVYDVEVRG